MKYIQRLFFISLLFVLASCSSRVSVHQPFHRSHIDLFSLTVSNGNLSVEDDVRDSMTFYIKKELRANQILDADGSHKDKEIEVTFVRFNMRDSSARFFSGALAGTDIIYTQVIVKDIKSGSILSKYFVETENKSAWGTSTGLMEQHAEKIVTYLTKTSPLAE
jgi:hypothetical protein